MLRLLFVEDDDDIRETLADLLRDEGYDVGEAESAERGLAMLAEARFDILLSDYRLPDQNGVEMITEAARRGALTDTAVLLLSASPHIDGASGLRVLQKPIELDTLTRELEQAMKAQPPAVTVRSGEDALRLVLFVLRPSRSAERAEQTMERLLERHGYAPSCLELVDVGCSEGRERAVAERIAFTPALLRLSPQPRRWIVGDLRRKAIVDRLLRESGAR